MRPGERGASILEMLVAITLTMVMAAATMSIILSSRSLYQTDQQRTSLNQGLRSGIDLISIDVLQAGAWLPDDVPVIFVTDGGGGPDTLVVRRNLLAEVLPLCETIAATSTVQEISVAKNTGTIPPGCNPLPDSDGDGWPDNMGAWRNYRIALGGTVEAYLYNPVTRIGEFFPIDTEDAATFRLHRANNDAWLADYNVADQPRVYLLEQRTYQVAAGVLGYHLNDDAANPVNLIADVTDFQVRAVFPGGPQDSMTAADDWTGLVALEVSLSGQRNYRGRTMDRSLTTRLFPRNILSR